MKIINQNKDDLLFHLNSLIKLRTDSTSESINLRVKKIISAVKLNGDEALIKYVKKYDNTSINKYQILISDQIRNNYKDKIDKNIIKSFEVAIKNITLFHKTITKEQVVQAAKAIGVHTFIESLPNKYDYVVGERGVTLSAGQRQLIAFLRVYVRNPKILILDEATSSIDSETEQLLQSTLSKLSQNRTTIVIAHRLSTIVSADKILHLEAGKVLEKGTHNDLMQKGEAYAKMYKLQGNNILIK